MRTFPPQGRNSRRALPRIFRVCGRGGSVADSCTLLYRRFATCGPLVSRPQLADSKSALQQNGNLGHTLGNARRRPQLPLAARNAWERCRLTSRQAGPASCRAQASSHGFVLVAVLIVIMLASMVAISLMFRLKAEDTASAASFGAEQAWAAAMSGVEEAMRVVAQSKAGSMDWQDNPAAFHEHLVCDDGSDQWGLHGVQPGRSSGRRCPSLWPHR